MEAMAQRRSPKAYALQPWVSANIDNREPAGYAQVGTSLFESKAFHALTPSQRYCYLCMVCYAKGRREFEFPRKCFKQFGIPHGTARASIDGLITAKFIEREYSGKIMRDANKYRFSLGWKLNAEESK